MFAHRIRRATVAALCLAAVGGPASAAQAVTGTGTGTGTGTSRDTGTDAAGPSASTPSPTGREARNAARFWTAARMADAQPLDGPRAAPKAPGQSVAAAGGPQGTAFPGTRLVGTFFGSDGPGGTTWHCTGSVLDTAARNIVLTAAHCGLNMNADYIFVPKFVMGAGPDQQPYGIFHIQRLFTDPRYVPDKGSSTTRTAASDLDTAFARVSANQRGQSLQDAVGGGLTFTQPSGYTNKNVTVVATPPTGTTAPAAPSSAPSPPANCPASGRCR
ncbi:trypsin-like serine protease [Streptomyces broussonetiae]|uniref:trypsin-like serine protease n=1 Tax=Streptomyces broussonetiae TaxID=2686304 RepID=UPI0035E057D6